MSYFLNWWRKFQKRAEARLQKQGYKLEWPHDIEAFILYLDSLPLNLQSKQEVVRNLARYFAGAPFKDSKRSQKRLRRALRVYEEFHEERTVFQFVAVPMVAV